MHGHSGPVSTALALCLQSAPIIIIIIILTFRGPSNYAVPLALTSMLTANYLSHTGFPRLSPCTSSLSVLLLLFLSICPSPPPLQTLLVCFSPSLPLSPPVLSAMAVFLGRWTGPMVVWSQWHCTFSPLSLSSLSSLPFSDGLFLAVRPQQFIGVALPRRYANCYSISPIATSLHLNVWPDGVCLSACFSVSFVYLCKTCVCMDSLLFNCVWVNI